MTPASEDAGAGAIAVPAAPPSGIIGFAQTPGGKNFFLMLGVAAVVAAMAAVWLWSRAPDYRVLFSNFSDRDGGAIVAALQQQNIPYKFAEGGGAILVPAEHVHDARLKLAAQGLPKASGVGFELMESQKLGISQFLEQVNFQRALEGELARSIQSVAAVQGARVHLAMPKASVFVRDQQKPTASVLLNLHPGRTLDPQQVSAIVHLVASSVPELTAKNVTLVDQNGNLLSENGKQAGANGLDPSQLKYVQELQQSIAKRIESILTPIVGASNVRAEATADVDFSRSEQAAEIYTPNGQPNNSAIRSQQTSENTGAGGAIGGIPGALTNQPQPEATAPVDAPPGATAAQGAQGQVPNTQRNATVNYEVDKTVRYVQQPMGGIKRLSVAVVVNYRKVVDAEGKVTMKPLTEAETTQITNLVREAMGYDKNRGDTLNVVNSPFAGTDTEELPDVPFWQRPEVIDMALVAGKWLVAAGVLAYLFFGVLRPLVRRIIEPYLPPPPEKEKEPEALENDAGDVAQLEDDTTSEEDTPRIPAYLNNLQAARELARNDPKVVANIIKSWVENE